jgi:hypothetical protein
MTASIASVDDDAQGRKTQPILRTDRLAAAVT